MFKSFLNDQVNIFAGLGGLRWHRVSSCLDATSDVVDNSPLASRVRADCAINKHSLLKSLTSLIVSFMSFPLSSQMMRVINALSSLTNWPPFRISLATPIHNYFQILSLRQQTQQNMVRSWHSIATSILYCVHFIVSVVRKREHSQAI